MRRTSGGFLNPDRIGFTVRDVVLGGALAIDQLWKDRPDDVSDEAAATKWGLALADVLINLIQEMPSGRSAFLYGLPRWMFNDRDENGVESSIVRLETALLEPLRVESDALNTGLEVAKARVESELGTSGIAEFLFELRFAVSEGRRLSGPPVYATTGHPTDTGYELAARDTTRPDSRYRERVRALSDRMQAADPLSKDWILAWESRARLERFEIPFSNPDGRRPVLMTARLQRTDGKATVVALSADELVERYDHTSSLYKDWEPASEDFRKAAERGVKAAVEYLASIGRKATVESARIELFGIVPPARAVGSSVAAPVALEFIRQELDLPPSDFAVSGNLVSVQNVSAFGQNTSARHFVLEALDKSVEEAKSRAVATDGYRRGLVRASRHSEPAKTGVRLADKSPLDTVARAMWGDAFERKLDLDRRNWLAAAGFVGGWPQMLPSRLVQTDPAERLVAAYVRSSPDNTHQIISVPPVAMLTGGRDTGKSTMAQVLSERLAAPSGTDHWDVAVLRATNHNKVMQTLSSPRALADLVSREVSILHQDRRKLLIFDDIEFDETISSTLEENFAELTNSDVHVLVLLRSDKSTDWPPFSVMFGSLQETNYRRNFVSQLIAQYPELESKEDELRSAADVGDGDVGWIIDVAEQRDPEAAVRSELAKATNAQREVLRDLAILSYYDLPAPAALADLARLGSPLEALAKWVVAVDGRSSIRSRVVARTIIATAQRSGADGPAIELASSRIGAVFDALLGSNRYQDQSLRDPEIALELSWTLQHRWKLLARRVLQPRSQDLLEWVGANGHELDDYIDLLRSSDRFLDTQSLFDALLGVLKSATHLIERRAIGLDTLREVIDALERNRGVLEAPPRSPNSWQADVRMEDFKASLSDNGGAFLCDLVCAEPSKRDAILLMAAMLRLYDPDLDRLVAILAAEAIESDPNRVTLRNLAAIVDIVTRANYSAKGSAADVEYYSFRSTLAEAVEKFDFKDASLDLYELCILEKLRLQFGLNEHEWDDEYELFHKSASRLIREAPMNHITAGFNLIFAQNHPFFVKYITKKTPFGQNFFLTSNRRPAEIAEFLGAITRWHSESAFNILHYRSGMDLPAPYRPLLNKIATQLKTASDGRNAGRIVMAAAKVDELYRLRGSGFAYGLVDALGVEFYKSRFQAETRSSILFYLVRGLSRIQHPFLRAVLPYARDHVRSSIESHMQPWTARFAAELAGDPEVGAEWRASMYDIVRQNRDNVLEGMQLSGDDPELIRAFHQIACFADPELAQKYARSLEPEGALLSAFDRVGRRGRSDLAVQAMLAVRTTLRRANARELIHRLDVEVGPMMFPIEERSQRAKLDTDGAKRTPMRPQIGWRFGCIKSARSEDVAEVLDVLRRMDPDLLSDCLELKRMRQPRGILADKLGRLNKRPALLVRYVMAIHRSAPEVAKEVVSNHFSTELFWRQFFTELQFIQNPREQAMLCRQLLKVDPALGDQFIPIRNLWMGRLNHLRSPGALVEVLRFHREMSEKLEDGIGFRASADQVHIDAVCRRIETRRRADLDFIAALAGLIWESGRHEDAIVMLETFLAPDVASIISPPRWTDALEKAERFSVAISTDVLDAFDDAAIRLAKSSCEFDDELVWEQLADFARARAGIVKTVALGLDECPASLKFFKDPCLQLRSLLWLQSAKWADELALLAISELRSHPPRPSHRLRRDLEKDLKRRSAYPNPPVWVSDVSTILKLEPANG